MTRLSDSEIQSKLAELPGWQLQNGALQRNFQFKDFVEAMAYVNKLAALAEEAGHHPDIDVRYNRVVLGLVTHDAGGITENDTAMAAQINKLSATAH
jgi:4a-hydroxytetrahydrobiopterin dehydratase